MISYLEHFAIKGKEGGTGWSAGRKTPTLSWFRHRRCPPVIQKPGSHLNSTCMAGNWLCIMVIIEKEILYGIQWYLQISCIMSFSTNGIGSTRHDTENLKVPLESLWNSLFKEYHDGLYFPPKNLNLGGTPVFTSECRQAERVNGW